MKAPRSIALLALLAPTLLACSGGPDIPSYRKGFLDAEAALAHGQLKTFEQITGDLEGYPLYPYLLYERLSRNLDTADPASIEEFLAPHADTPLAGRLRRAWLGRLAKEGRWNEYLHFYAPDDSILRRCHYLHALLSADRRDEVFAQMAPLWLHGRSLPGACDPLLEAWKQAGHLTTDLTWRRIALAMATDEPKLAAYLSKSLPAEERIWAERWIAIYRDPRQLLGADDFAEAHPYRARMLAQGIARLAPKVPSQTADLWDRLTAQLDFPQEQAQLANAAVGFALSAAGDRRGLSYLDRVPARQDNFDKQERRLRAALRLGSWNYVANWIAAMPGGQRKSEHWLYWQARAEEILGNAGTAQDLFEAAAAERSLWGFLAAERMGHPYKLGETPTPADPKRLARIEQSATAARIRELEALGRERDLGREWQWLTRDMSNEDLLAAAVLAQRRGWPKRAIVTLARSDYWDDLSLRFPLLHRKIVRDRAAATDLDTSWIYAVLRQESIFDPKARSGAGAMGLMQLMPATAQEVATSLGLPRPAVDELYAPRLNITLGSAYLAGMQSRFRGNMVLATAAYNAGPGNVDRWLPRHPVDADIWIATIPWRETRGYVRRVLAYRVIYDYRLKKPIKPLRGIMRRIGRKSDEDLGASAESGIPDHAGS